MKSVIRFAIVASIMTAASVSVSAATKGRGLATAPGQAENFYRGVTTLAPVVEKELVSATPVVVSSDTATSTDVDVASSSSTVTRTIGSGKGNPTGNLQDATKTSTTTTTPTTAVTTTVIDTTNVYDVTTTVNSHHGAPVSNGKALEPVITESSATEVVTRDEVTTDETSESATTESVGDWGPAYDVPSGTK